MLYKFIFSVEGSTIIQNLGLGIGTFLGGLVGLSYIFRWSGEWQRHRLSQKYKTKYPEATRIQNWDLWFDPEQRGHIFILDHINKTKYWIANYRTLQDIFRKWPDAKKDSDQNKDRQFNEYQTGEEILTTGDPEP